MCPGFPAQKQTHYTHSISVSLDAIYAFHTMLSHPTGSFQECGFSYVPGVGAQMLNYNQKTEEYNIEMVCMSENRRACPDRDGNKLKE